MRKQRKISGIEQIFQCILMFHKLQANRVIQAGKKLTGPEQGNLKSAIIVIRALR